MSSKILIFVIISFDFEGISREVSGAQDEKYFLQFCARHAMAITFCKYPLIITNPITCSNIQIPGLEETFCLYRSIVCSIF